MVLVDEPNTLIIYSKRKKVAQSRSSPSKSGEGVSFDEAAADVVEDYEQPVRSSAY